MNVSELPILAPLTPSRASLQAPARVVRTVRHGDVAILTIDNGSANTCSAAVRRELLAAVRALEQETGLVAAVLIGAGTHFMTGSDLRKLGAAIHQPELPEVIVAIEQCSLPIIAAMHGATLGSGFEIALACDGRICAPDAVVGLPQVSLGVIPGGGATQRLVGRAVAVDMVCSGRSVGADEAIPLKVVDRVEAGPVVMLAAGGIWAEVARDRSIRLAPVTIEAAREMVDEVRALRTVSGLRGKARGDLEALAAAVCALSQLALKPKLGIHEAEVNPMVLAERQGVVAMDALILRLPRPSGTG